MTLTLEQKGLKDTFIKLLNQLIPDDPPEKELLTEVGFKDPNLYTLHIGLNKVDPKRYNGWDGKLTGAVNDCQAMLSFFLKRSAHSISLYDDGATIGGLFEGLSYLTHLVANNSNPSKVVITYSGHGGQVVDTNGDEIDGRDETWCLYDGQMTDDGICQLLSNFRKDTTIVVISDSCHSGTVTRANNGFVPIPYDRRAKIMPDSLRMDFKRYKNSQALLDERIIILLAACAENQYAYDLTEKAMGMFTYHMIEVMKEKKPKTIRALMKEVSKRMPQEQSPQLFLRGAASGSFVDQEIL